jgi:hypothetical protein
MRWTVSWEDVALEYLADAWTRAPDRQAVNDAVKRAERELAWSPETKGQAFYGDRLLVVLPLQLVYKVDADKHEVTILHVW